MQFDWAQKILLWLIPLIFAVTVHEVAHGFVASRRGDCTAKMLGRLTLNPLKHIDLVGTVLLPLALLFLSAGHFTFGYAKPVPVNERNLKNPRWDSAWVSLAGPVANFIMAFLWAALIVLGQQVQSNNPWVADILMSMGMAGVQINVVLAVLNLIPIPPLDGSRVLAAFLSTKAAWGYLRFERYGFILLIILLATGLLGRILWPVVYTLVSAILSLFGLSIG